MPKKRRKAQPNSLLWSKSKILISVVMGIILVSLIFLVRVFLAGSSDSFTVAVAKENGDIELLVTDFADDYLASIRIPAGTEANLAMQRGTLRISSAWKLAKSEDLPGQIIADTVMRTFHIPVDYWGTERSLRTLLSTESDLPLLLRLRLIFATKKANIDKIDLAETAYLSEVDLLDGEGGYRVNGTLPLAVSSLVSDGQIASSRTAVLIVNKTGVPNYLLSDAISVFEVLGGKVAPVIEGAPEALDCTVSAVDKKMRSRVAKVFNCEEIAGVPESFDIEVVFGTEFIDRF